VKQPLIVVVLIARLAIITIAVHTDIPRFGMTLR